jgi:hypothetical protein
MTETTVLVSLARQAARIVRTTAPAPPPGLIDAVRGGEFIDDRCEFRCSLEEAGALRDWLWARAETTRAADAATADVLTRAAADVAEAIAHELM